ncbi:hypothetical protein NDI38_13105 [Stenomitos frigidus AS-A4]|uniref:Uncharacterized protein n=1 Tax=Stenomitos frigidus AS-A4 TaxID=2933935 RepID=A0ABV0KJJ5_9CYAN
MNNLNLSNGVSATHSTSSIALGMVQVEQKPPTVAPPNDPLITLFSTAERSPRLLSQATVCFRKLHPVLSI